jgi:hypothetical protein
VLPLTRLLMIVAAAQDSFRMPPLSTKSPSAVFPTNGGVDHPQGASSWRYPALAGGIAADPAVGDHDGAGEITVLLPSVSIGAICRVMCDGAMRESQSARLVEGAAALTRQEAAGDIVADGALAECQGAFVIDVATVLCRR